MLIADIDSQNRRRMIRLKHNVNHFESELLSDGGRQIKNTGNQGVRHAEYP